MADILVVVEHQDGVFKKNTLSVVSAAKVLAGLTGGEVDALVLGDGVGAVADIAAGTGVRKVSLAKGRPFREILAATYAGAVAQVVKAGGTARCSHRHRRSGRISCRGCPGCSTPPGDDS